MSLSTVFSSSSTARRAASAVEVDAGCDLLVKAVSVGVHGRRQTHDGPAASSSSFASPPVALGPVGRACTRLRVRRRGRRGFVERVCTCGGHQSRLILFFSFTAKCGVSAPTCVRVWAGGDSAFFLIASLSFCLAYHRVRGGMGY